MSSAPSFGRRGLQGPTFPPPGASAPPPPPSRTGDPLDLGWLLFSFQGRIPRLHYWLAQAGVLVVFRIVVLVCHSLSDSLKAAQASGGVSPALLILALVGLLLCLGTLFGGFWVSLAVVVKRWHDRGKSWPWALLGFVPLVGWVWQGIECGFLEGTLGPNQFGPSPKGIVGVNYGEFS